MKHKPLFFLYIIVFFLSCGEENSSKTFNRFPLNYILQPEFIALEENYVHGSVLVYDTLYFLTNTPNDTFQIHIYNKSFSYLGSGGRIGNGPGEIINPFLTRIDQKSGTLWFADMGRQELLKFPIDTLVKNYRFSPNESVPIPDDLWILISYDPLDENLFRFEDYQTSSALISFFNDRGERIDSLKVTRNPMLENLESKQDQSYLPTFMCEFHPEKDLIALGYRFSDILAILNTDGEILFIVQGPDDINQLPDLSDDNQINCYAHIQVDENYIYMLYNGKPSFDAQQNLNVPDRIFVFNWEGKPVASFMLEHPIPQFTLDKVNKRLVAMSITTGDVVFYDIPDELYIE
jgi:hypothetical protein